MKKVLYLSFGILCFSNLNATRYFYIHNNSSKETATVDYTTFGACANGSISINPKSVGKISTGTISGCNIKSLNVRLSPSNQSFSWSGDASDESHWSIDEKCEGYSSLSFKKI